MNNPTGVGGVLFKGKTAANSAFQGGFPLAPVLSFCVVKVFLIGVGVTLYWMDVGLDVDSGIRWATMNGCFRLLFMSG